MNAHTEATDDRHATALVIGGTGGIGAAIADALRGPDAPARNVIATSRRGSDAVDICDEASVAALASRLKSLSGDLTLVIDATGFLHDETFTPEKTWRHIDPAHMAHAFAVNAIGPALLMKHLLPLLPAQGRSVFATLSARVGSIGDNRLGGWTSYRASKAALNQIVRTTAIELHRRKPDAICVALHPGTVATDLSAPFSTDGLDVRDPDTAAEDLLSVIKGLQPSDNGGFLDHNGAYIPW
ncbi:MAG: SDR family NAD(P)-dependent oxidoreductase [Minwuia sp.]|nr:SDR family NAD(P)-dependent oxidoreductase [Minwuia sp.]